MPPRRWCRTALATFVWFLAFAATAHAECAWVLWPQDLGGGFRQSLLVFETRKECEAAKGGFIKDWDPKKEEEWPVTVRRAHPSHWHCLPDSIDPREPKAK